MMRTVCRNRGGGAISGRLLPGVSTAVWRGRELGALELVERAVGRVVVHQGGLIHVSDLEAVSMAHCLWYSEQMSPLNRLENHLVVQYMS